MSRLLFSGGSFNRHRCIPCPHLPWRSPCDARAGGGREVRWRDELTLDCRQGRVVHDESAVRGGHGQVWRVGRIGVALWRGHRELRDVISGAEVCFTAKSIWFSVFPVMAAITNTFTGWMVNRQENVEHLLLGSPVHRVLPRELLNCRQPARAALFSWICCFVYSWQGFSFKILGKYFLSCSKIKRHQNYHYISCKRYFNVHHCTVVYTSVKHIFR